MKREWKYFLLGTSSVVALIMMYHFIFNQGKEPIVREILIEPENNNQVHQTGFMPFMGMDSQTMDFTFAADQTINSVVHVNTVVIQTKRFRDPMMEYFFGPDAGVQERQYRGEGSGSGVILTDDGYIVTNNHVIQHAQEIKITLNNNTEYEAQVVGTDPSTDLALLKIEANNLTPVKMGNSDNVKIGEWVLAVGNPFNLNSTVTAGIVSAKARNINIIRPNGDQKVFPIESFIQTDAAVNPGNSGGALVNTNGELIGINTAIASGTGYYTGYSFAIPVNLVQKIMGDLMVYGSVRRAMMGVQIRDIDQKLIEDKNLSTSQGVYIENIQEGGGADKAGLKEGDIIIKIDGVQINSTPKLQEEIGKKNPNEIIDVTVLRGKQMETAKVKLKGIGEEIASISGVSKTATALGAQFMDADKEELEKLKINSGVKVIRVHPGKMMAAGIPKGFIITKIDNKSVSNSKELENYLKNKTGGVLIEGYTEDGEKAYFGFGI